MLINRPHNVPVFVEDVDGGDFVSLGMVFTYDATVVYPIGVSTDGTLTAGWVADFNVISGQGTPVDTLYVGMFTDDDLLSESGVLCHITMEATEGASAGDTTLLRFERVRFDEDTIAVNTRDGVLYIVDRLFGDVTGNMEVSPYDAAWILQHTVGLRTLAGEDSVVADVSGDGTLSPYDAALVLQYVLRKILRFPVEEVGEAKVAPLVLSGRRIWAGELEHSADGRICLPIFMDEVDGVVAGEMALSFSDDIGDVEIRTSTLTSDCLLAWNVRRGVIKVSFAGAESRSGRGRLLNVLLDGLDGTVPRTLRLDEVSLNEGRIPSRIVEQRAEIPTSCCLRQNGPNPFNAETVISYDIPSISPVRICVYALNGQRVRTLADDVHPAGRHAVVWNGRDESGQDVASGVYLCRMEAGSYHAVRKLVFLQ